MNTRKLSAISLFVMALILLGFGDTDVVFAQSQSNPCSNPSKDFAELADLRGRLKTEIAENEQSIKELPSKIDEAKSAERDLQDANKKLQDLKAKPPATGSSAEAYQQQVGSLEKLKASIEKFLAGNSSESYRVDLETARSKLGEHRQHLLCVEKALYTNSSPEQFFKIFISVSFAVLILAVIAGFYYLSAKDEKVRQAIFSGQEGIQFLTLFSLVIAIILFGVTGILQDKELAALLGGLSGYILGRYNAPA